MTDCVKNRNGLLIMRNSYSIQMLFYYSYFVLIVLLIKNDRFSYRKWLIFISKVAYFYLVNRPLSF